MKKRLVSIILALTLTVSSGISVCAADYVATESSVSDNMCNPDYWKAQTVLNANQVLMSYEQIEKFNASAVIITPLNVRRRNGSTWIDNVSGIVTPWTVAN